jgi:hypothetical protein
MNYIIIFGLIQLNYSYIYFDILILLGLISHGHDLPIIKKMKGENLINAIQQIIFRHNRCNSPVWPLRIPWV